MLKQQIVNSARWVPCLVTISLLAVCTTPAAQSPGSSAVTEEELRLHVETLGTPDMRGRDTPGSGGDLAARYIAQSFKNAGLEPVGLADLETVAPADLEPVAPTLPDSVNSENLEPYFDSFSVQGPVNNVVGVLWGEDPSAGTVVLGAHYDGVGARGGALMPLSDDNASGTAILIAVASALARSAATEGPLPHTVVFLGLGSEEDGLLGARHYCEHPPVPLQTTRAMLNLDTVGRPRSERLEIVGWSRYQELSAVLARAAADEGVEAVPGPRSLWYRSDQAVFADAGVPAIWLLGHLRDDIHSRADTPDRLDYEWMARVARALVAATRTGFGENASR